MAVSEIQICNLALAMIGAESIRSFSEDNIRARMCKSFYDYTRDYLLYTFDWPFARGRKIIRRVDPVSLDDDLPEGVYAYSMPADLLVPREPEGVKTSGSRLWWRVQGEYLWLQLDVDTTGLYYTRRISNVVLFSEAFIQVVSLGLAVKLAVPISQDKSIARTLFQQYTFERGNAMALEANMGSEYIAPDDNANLDSYITGQTNAQLS